jgi:hypothetical protein
VTPRTRISTETKENPKKDGLPCINTQAPKNLYDYARDTCGAKWQYWRYAMLKLDFFKGCEYGQSPKLPQKKKRQ